MKNKLRIGIVGFGNMGRAIGEAVSSCSACAVENLWKVYAYDKDRKKTKGISKIVTKGTLKGLFEECNVIILAIKPQDIKEFVDNSKSYLFNKNYLLISIAAGVPTYSFEKQIRKIRVVRVMPNLAAKVKEAVSFICRGKFATKKDLENSTRIFKNIGKVFAVKEEFLDKATSISGSGPGYVYYFMDSMMEAALKLGFSEKTAKDMVKQTFTGAVKLAVKSNKNFSKLLKDVASRGGTTEAALRIFERRKVSSAVNDAVSAAYKRAKELAKASSQLAAD